MFLINMKEGKAHLLNPVAALIIEYIKECGSLDEGLKKTKEFFYDIDPIAIENDYYRFTNELMEKKILVNEH